jgi:hypothetical protein
MVFLCSKVEWFVLVFEWLKQDGRKVIIASLDPFIQNNILFMTLYIKRSRLVGTIQKFVRFSNGLLVFDRSKTGHKLCPKNCHLNTGSSRFRMVTVPGLIFFPY